jgi:hypothetical protein
MRIRKGTFKIRESPKDADPQWTYYEGSFGHDFPFYVHRKQDQTTWNLSHVSTGYAIRRNISLKQARHLSRVLKEWPLFLMPTAETLMLQQRKLSTHKQQLLKSLVDNCGEKS